MHSRSLAKRPRRFLATLKPLQSLTQDVSFGSRFVMRGAHQGDRPGFRCALDVAKPAPDQAGRVPDQPFEIMLQNMATEQTAQSLEIVIPEKGYQWLNPGRSTRWWAVQPLAGSARLPPTHERRRWTRRSLLWGCTTKGVG